MLQHRLYGLVVASERPLLDLPQAKGGGDADVVFSIGTPPSGPSFAETQWESPGFVSSLHGPNGQPLLQVWHSSRNGYSCFKYCEGFAFLIDPSGRQVWGTWSDPVTFEDVAGFFLSHILGFLLHLRGAICLHASAVAVEGAAVLFSANSGAGKSSTAAAFTERGCPILADDTAVVRQEAGGQLVVVPGFPRVCLWPDSADFIYGAGSTGRYPRVQPQEDKRLVRLDYAPGKFQTQAAPLGAVYLLTPRSAEPSAPRIESIGDADKLMALLPNSFETLVLNRELRRSEFRMLAEIVRRAPVKGLVPSSDPQKLGQLCQFVIDDLHGVDRSLAGQLR